MEDAVKDAAPDIMIGHSKGYSLSRKLGIPLIEASTADSPLGILQAYYAGGGSR